MGGGVKCGGPGATRGCSWVKISGPDTKANYQDQTLRLGTGIPALDTGVRYRDQEYCEGNRTLPETPRVRQV